MNKFKKLTEKIKTRFQFVAKKFEPLKTRLRPLWLKIKPVWTLIRDTFVAFGKHRVMKMSAALSYYTIFSLPAVLVIIISLTSIIFGQEIVEGKVFKIMNDYIGDQTALQLQSMLRQTVLKKTNVWATIIGGITLLLSASGVFGEIQDSLNYMWGLKPKPKKGFISLLINRLMSFSMLLILAFILLVSLLLTSLLDLFFNTLIRHLPSTWIKIFDYADDVVIVLAVSTLFMFLFKFLPDGKMRWKDAFLGSLITAILFMIGKSLISLYLSNTSLTAYGGTASLAILLIWVYYSSIIMYIGAEFTQVYASFKGRSIEPKKFAVRVEVKEKEKAGSGKK
jgi:membrane protein